MSHLLIRPSGTDARVLAQILTDGGIRPDRVVLDATAAIKDSWAAIRVAGLPLLIDPLTYYLQDHQAPGTAWSRLPYAQLAALRPADFTDRFVDQLIDKHRPVPTRSRRHGDHPAIRARRTG